MSQTNEFRGEASCAKHLSTWDIRTHKFSTETLGLGQDNAASQILRPTQKRAVLFVVALKFASLLYVRRFHLRLCVCVCTEHRVGVELHFVPVNCYIGFQLVDS